MPVYKCNSCGATARVPSSFPGITFRERDFATVLRFAPFSSSCGQCQSPVLTPFPAVFIGKDFAVRLTPGGFAPMEDIPAPDTLRIQRETEDVLSFREKILLLSTGYDDRAIEYLKLITMKANEEQGLTNILVLDLDNESLHMSALSKEGDDLLYRSPLDFYRSLRDQIPEEGWETHGYALVNTDWVRRRVVEV